MTDYISREALRKELIDARKDYSFQDDKPWDLGFHNGLSIAQRILDELPAADVRENKRGKWMGELVDDSILAPFKTKAWKCDQCGYEYVNPYREQPHNYCPNCGAQMSDGEEQT